MFQLPPVVRQGPEKDLLKDLYHTEDFFFYKSNAIKRMRLVKIEFQKVYRQDDAHFLHILENVRMNKVTPEDIMHLNDRVRVPNEEDGAVITLASINKTADKINLQRLEEIEAEEFVYEGTVDGTFEEKRFPVELKLRLKVGAQVMFTRNDLQKRWANGTLGKVTKLTKDEISVTLNNGETYVVPCCSWESYSYDYNKEERKMKKELTGTFTQYPLKLAWAITIHKSQGMTFDKLSLDLSRGCSQLANSMWHSAVYVHWKVFISQKTLFLSMLTLAVKSLLTQASTITNSRSITRLRAERQFIVLFSKMTTTKQQSSI